ncbi:hypothetical protein [Falsirhodobacter xinxiangensis]|uniref:hypothetical protein n=1 Tax=Falsirhodobacter xinxiangensis TaxID=2530049 RepID=UPI0010AADA2C|nr:hypothetical protein [Rhodobacter xinxiangensis]
MAAAMCFVPFFAHADIGFEPPFGLTCFDQVPTFATLATSGLPGTPLTRRHNPPTMYGMPPIPTSHRPPGGGGGEDPPPAPVPLPPAIAMGITGLLLLAGLSAPKLLRNRRNVGSGGGI